MGSARADQKSVVGVGEVSDMRGLDNFLRETGIVGGLLGLLVYAATAFPASALFNPHGTAWLLGCCTWGLACGFVGVLLWMRRAT